MIAHRFGLGEMRILPMSDQRVETWIETDEGEMHFQEYYIKHAMRPGVRGVKIKGASEASAAPSVLDSIDGADLVIICPSNPIISIGPILEISGDKGKAYRHAGTQGRRKPPYARKTP